MRFFKVRKFCLWQPLRLVAPGAKEASYAAVSRYLVSISNDFLTTLTEVCTDHYFGVGGDCPR